MGKRRRYTDEERATLVVMLESEGYPGKRGALTTVSSYSSVPTRTLQRWFLREVGQVPDKIVAQKKLSTIELLNKFIFQALTHANKKDTVEDMNAKEAIISAATAIDKKRLLEGESTEIIEINLDKQLETAAAAFARHVNTGVAGIEPDEVSEQPDNGATGGSTLPLADER